MAFGTHGPGVRSLALLLSMEQLIDELLNRTKKMHAWYAIVAVDRLNDNGTYPLSLAAVPIIYKIDGQFGKIAEIISRELNFISLRGKHIR
jgi:hypothetical protein